MASRYGQWSDPCAGVTECCSLLAGHREITGGGEASIEEAGAEGLSFELLNRNVDQRFNGPVVRHMRSGNLDVVLEANESRRGQPAARYAEVSARLGRQRELRAL